MVSWALGSTILLISASEAGALTPPRHSSTHAIDGAWTGVADGFERCSAMASAGNRSGTVWVDMLLSSPGAPTWKLRTSPGLISADKTCVRKIIVGHLLPALADTYQVVDEPIATKEIALGGITRYLPPLATFLPAWLEVTGTPSKSAGRARLDRSVKSLGAVARDGCLLVRREARLQRARRDWLISAGREVPFIWQSLVDRLAKPMDLGEPALFVVDGALLFAGARVDGTVRYNVERAGQRATAVPPSWSRQWETYCVQPLGPDLLRSLERGVDEISECVAGTGAERLVDLHLEPPKDRKLHAVSVAERRYCGIDEAGAIRCCGVRSGVPPQGAFTAVSVDDKYACAIAVGGELACWGEAALGARPPAGHYSKLDVGQGGACALSDQRHIRCWGVPPGWQTPTGELVDVALGPASAYAVGTDGTLLEWGARTERRPAAASRVVVGDCQACVLTRAGAVDCRDEKGQQAHFDGPMTAFAPACSGGCGLRPDGSLACVGAGGLPPPADLARESFSEIASTRDRYCATIRSGRVACWGEAWPGTWMGRRLTTGGQP